MITKIGIVIADGMEYTPFAKYAHKKATCAEEKYFGNDSISFTLHGKKNDLEITCVKCGIGKVNAASATAFLIADKKADAIFNVGLSGAIHEVVREDVVVGTSFVEADFDLTAIGRPLGAKPEQEYIYYADEQLLNAALSTFDGIKKGRFGSGDIFLADPFKKRLYKESFHLSAFDMETAAIASVCHKAQVPFLSIRKISDDADDCATDAYTEMNNRAEIALSEVLFRLFGKLSG